MAVPPRVPVAFPERIPVVARGTVVVFLVVVAKIGIDLEIVEETRLVGTGTVVGRERVVEKSFVGTVVETNFVAECRILVVAGS